MTDESKDRAMPLADGAAGPPSQAGTPRRRFFAQRGTRAAYGFQTVVPLRWSDFDMMGHVNNVQFMRLFECAVGISSATRRVPSASTVTAFAAEHVPLLRPQTIRSPPSIAACGWSGCASPACASASPVPQGGGTPSAVGYWVHVFIDRKTMRSAPMPDQSRQVFEKNTWFPAPGRCRRGIKKTGAKPRPVSCFMPDSGGLLRPPSAFLPSAAAISILRGFSSSGIRSSRSICSSRSPGWRPSP
jgi:acyl-CoA thioester hydrolase